MKLIGANVSIFGGRFAFVSHEPIYQAQGVLARNFSPLVKISRNVLMQLVTLRLGLFGGNLVGFLVIGRFIEGRFELRKFIGCLS